MYRGVGPVCAQMRSVEVVGQLTDQFGLGQGTHESLDNLTLDVDVHRRDPGNAVTRGDFGILVGVELDDRHLAGVFGGKFLEDGGN